MMNDDRSIDASDGQCIGKLTCLETESGQRLVVISLADVSELDEFDTNDDWHVVVDSEREIAEQRMMRNPEGIA